LFTECTSGYDVTLVLDVSVSVHRKVGIEPIRSFIAKVVEFLDIGETRSLVGLIYFAGEASVAFDLQQYKTKRALISALKNREYPKERGSQFVPVLQLLHETAHNTSMGFRPDYPNIAIVITEGELKDSDSQLQKAAKEFHVQQWYQLFIVGIGNVDQDQLETVTGDPSLVYLVDKLDEQAREQAVHNLSLQLCKSQGKHL